MFCWKCGKELSEHSRFCTNCGARVVNVEELLRQAPPEEEPSGGPGEKLSAPLAKTEHGGGQVPVAAAPMEDTAPLAEEPSRPLSETEVPETEKGAADESANVPESHGGSAPVPVSAPVPDMVIRKKKISVKNGSLLVDGSYYRRKGRRFKRKKGQIGIPLSLVTGYTVCRKKKWGKVMVSFLLVLIFAAGTAISGYFGWQTWQQIRTPYNQDRIADLEEALEDLSGPSQEKLESLEAQLNVSLELQEKLNTELEQFESQRRQEILRTAVADSSFDISALFTSDFFADAYEQYLEDLLDAFQSDQMIHSWLYPYYSYSVSLGENPYIEDELHFYTMDQDAGIFSRELQDPETFLKNTYNYDLERHIYYTGRIYITASDFLNRVLLVPNYVANGAVFVKAFGGNPDPSAMDVPGWDSSDYSRFWSSAESYYDSPDPVWLKEDISAEDFDIDWDQLANEQAFYDAYLKFMDTIAPGLGVFDKVTYSAGDDSYGGMYYEITGREASVTEIVTQYIENHPEYLETVDFDMDALPSSLDGQLAETQDKLDKNAAQIESLTQQKNQLTEFIDSENTLRAEYEQLTADKAARLEQLRRSLLFFGGIFLLLLLMTLFNLIMFFRLAKKPGKLMILELNDGTAAAFSTGFCSKKDLAALQEILPTLPPDPHT